MAKLSKEMASELEIKEQVPNGQQVEMTQIGFTIPKIPVSLTINFNPDNLDSIRVSGPQIIMMNKPYMHFLLALAMESVHNLHFHALQQAQGKAIIPASESDLELVPDPNEIANKNRKLLGLD